MKNNFCSVCSATGMTEIHHIVPVSLGGPDTLSNKIELCLTCHSKAHNHRAEWRNKIRKGIEEAKKKGIYKGRPPSINKDQVIEMKKQGVGATNIARSLGIGRASVYRILEDVKNDEL